MREPQNRPRFILTDIEGTTSSLEFVREVLFPYAAQRLERFVRQHAEDEAVRLSLRETAETLGIEQPGRDACTRAEMLDALLLWIDQDRKHSGLKRLQGMIWAEGFAAGDFRAHVYPDVPQALARWQAAGIRLGVYSSGSVQAQQVYFAHTEAGDLSPYFEAWFDTVNAGAKRQVASYRVIYHQLGLPAGEILFLSDIAQELDAAAEAGMQTRQLLRSPATVPSERHPQAASFDTILAH